MKSALRKQLLEKRNALEKAEYAEKSRQIKKNLLALPEFKDAQTVMFYVSFNGEVFTHDLIKETLKNKQVVVPKVMEKHLILCEIHSFDELDEKDKFGILQPSKSKEIKKEDVDLIIVPGVGFDKNGHRLGYGYGYYDRFLENVEIPAIGLAFDFQIFEKLPVYDHDVRMKKIITEKRVLEFK